MPELRKPKPKDRPSKIVQFQVDNYGKVWALDVEGDLMLLATGGWHMVARTSKKRPEEMDDAELLAHMERTELSVRNGRRRR